MLKRYMPGVLAAAAALAVVMLPGLAHAYPTWTEAAPANPVQGATCDQCHSTTSSGGVGNWNGSGPHKSYSTTTKKCTLCHAVHAAPATSVLLLRGATVTATCQMCHDGTGATVGVYATIEAQGGTVRASHDVDVTNIIPGGGSLADNLGCGDCHSVHGSNTVTPFLRDSGRAFRAGEYVVSDSLLRRDVNGVTVNEYGAEWCAACHDQRHSASLTVKNHPVATDADWVYRNVVSTLTAATEHKDNPSFGGDGIADGLGHTNGAYIMGPVASSGDGRIEEANRKRPMCQQCHEDARNVEAIFQGDYTHRGNPVTEPWLAPVNPEFETFPHQTTSSRLLVEEWDDLCLNCHAIAALP